MKKYCLYSKYSTHCKKLKDILQKNTKDFNYIWIILSWIGLLVCGCPLICHTLQLIIGYICHSSKKK